MYVVLVFQPGKYLLSCCEKTRFVSLSPSFFVIDSFGTVDRVVCVRSLLFITPGYVVVLL